MITEALECGIPIDFPTTFGQYNYVKTIGRGSNGIVILCQHITTHSFHACKIVARKQLEDTDVIQQFIQEIDILRFLHHPHILEIYDVLYDQAHICVLSEYCSGGTLHRLVVEHGSLDYRDLQHYFYQLVIALQFLHSHGIAHRDLKPENILIDKNGNVRLADFGLSRQFRPDALLSTPCGSPFYSAPEVLLGRAYDGVRSDLWSLGVVLFAIATGTLPWTARTRPLLLAEVCRASFTIPASVESAVAALVAGLIRVDPAERLSTQELLESELLRPAAPERPTRQTVAFPRDATLPRSRVAAPLAFARVMNQRRRPGMSVRIPPLRQLSTSPETLHFDREILTRAIT
jgi:serine/threonine protein kinase